MHRFNFFKWTFRFFFFSFSNWINIAFIIFLVFLFAIPSVTFWHLNDFYNPAKHTTIENFNTYNRFFATFFNNIFPIFLMVLIFLVLLLNISYVYENNKSATNDIVVSSIGKFFNFCTILIISFSFYIFYSLIFFLASGIIMLIFIQQFYPSAIFVFITQLKGHSFSDIYKSIYLYSDEKYCYLPLTTVILFSILSLFLNGFLYVLLGTGLTSLSQSFLDIFLFVIFIFILPLALRNIINLFYNNLVNAHQQHFQNIITIIFSIIPIISNGYFPVYLVEYNSLLGIDAIWPIFISLTVIVVFDFLIFFLMKKFYYYGLFSFSFKGRIWRNIARAF